MDNKILTIIVPAYNMESYLEKCLSSLLVDSSLLQKFEVLVINDGSKDKTSDIAHKFEANFPKTFRTIDKENGHYGSCINRGLKEALGTFVKILDADDIFDTAVFSSFLCFLSRTDIIDQVDAVLSDFSTVDTFGNIHKTEFSEQKEIFNIKSLSSSDQIKWFTAGLTYKTSLLRQIKYYQTEGIAYTDQEWVFIPMAYVNKIARFGASLYLYMVGRDGQSISDSVHAKNLWMDVVVLENIIDFFSCVKGRISEENRAFLSERIYVLTTHIYELYLIAYKYLTEDDRIKQLDLKLNTSNSALYTRLDGHMTTIGGIPFHFIRNWRKKRFFMLKMQSVVYTVANIFNKLKRRAK